MAIVLQDYKILTVALCVTGAPTHLESLTMGRMRMKQVRERWHCLQIELGPKNGHRLTITLTYVTLCNTIEREIMKYCDADGVYIT